MTICSSLWIYLFILKTAYGLSLFLAASGEHLISIQAETEDKQHAHTGIAKQNQNRTTRHKTENTPDPEVQKQEYNEIAG